MKTLIGIVTFGNLPFTRLTIQEINRSTKAPIDFFVIVGKPGDVETIQYLEAMEIPHLVHQENWGFPSSINDIYDYAWPSVAEGSAPTREERAPWHWPHADYDNLIIAGNDVVPYPDAIDALIRAAAETEYEWICASQFDAQSLVSRYPEARPYFEGPNLIFTNFAARPWELHQDFRASEVEPDVIKDVHNLCLYKRSVAEKIGYIDVNFFPAYFSDNDYCTRALRTRQAQWAIRSCGLAHSAYFHFWSRTIHQGSGGSTGRYFGLNAEFYQAKWGGPFGQERYTVPFDGKLYTLPGSRLVLPPMNQIAGRQMERDVVRYWRERGRE